MNRIGPRKSLRADRLTNRETVFLSSQKAQPVNLEKVPGDAKDEPRAVSAATGETDL
jgi:hypothetical protein